MSKINDDNPTLTDAERAEFRPARDVLPTEVLAAFRNKGGRPTSKNPKVQVSIRLDKDLLDALQADHPDWRSLINDTMRAKVLRAPGGA